MTTERRLADGIVAALASLQIPIELQEVQLVRPVRPEHGDWSTNAALVVAKSAGRAPREVAGDLAAVLQAAAMDDVVAVEARIRQFQARELVVAPSAQRGDRSWNKELRDS
jgi:arginyl-tRNA synthetase